MTAYLNIHIALEQRRIRALKLHRNSPTLDESRNDSGEIGYSEPPRVLVLGPENSGKTTFCKILANYIVRAGQGWTPMLVNLDPSEVRKNSNHLCMKLTSLFREDGQFQVQYLLLPSFHRYPHLRLLNH